MSVIPHNLSKFITWVRLQLSKRSSFAKTLSLSEAVVAASNEKDNKALQMCQEAADALALSASKVEARDAYLKTYNTTTSADIARYKTNPLYTEALGKDCEWLDPTPAVDLSTLTPSLKVVFSPEGIRLDWSKDGQDGVQVYRRKAGETAWVFLAFDTRTPYIDTETGLSGTYEYYVQLMKADKPVGHPSAIVTAKHG